MFRIPNVSQVVSHTIWHVWREDETQNRSSGACQDFLAEGKSARNPRETREKPLLKSGWKNTSIQPITGWKNTHIELFLGLKKYKHTGKQGEQTRI